MLDSMNIQTAASNLYQEHHLRILTHWLAAVVQCTLILEWRDSQVSMLEG